MAREQSRTDKQRDREETAVSKRQTAQQLLRFAVVGAQTLPPPPPPPQTAVRRTELIIFREATSMKAAGIRSRKKSQAIQLLISSCGTHLYNRGQGRQAANGRDDVGREVFEKF